MCYTYDVLEQIHKYNVFWTQNFENNVCDATNSNDNTVSKMHVLKIKCWTDKLLVRYTKTTIVRTLFRSLPSPSCWFHSRCLWLELCGGRGRLAQQCKLLPSRRHSVIDQVWLHLQKVDALWSTMTIEAIVVLGILIVN